MRFWWEQFRYIHLRSLGDMRVMIFTDRVGAALRILVVDDEPAIHEVVGLFLEGESVALSFASNGGEALGRLLERDFDLVITDRNMPIMGGDELAAQVRKIAPQMPILLISGHAEVEIDKRRFDAFLPKPFSKRQLGEAVRSMDLRRSLSPAAWPGHGN